MRAKSSVGEDMATDWRVRQLEDFELFYRNVGLLGSGFRVTQEDREFVAAATASQLDCLAKSQWLGAFAPGSGEMALLGRIHGSNVLRWVTKGIDYGELVAALAKISRGSFSPGDLAFDYLSVEGDEYHEIRCTWAGAERYVMLPRRKWMQYAVFVELNRWIASTGRQFAKVGSDGNGEPLFACLDDHEAAVLADRGHTIETFDTWDTDPLRLVPVVEHFLAQRWYERAIDVTSFNLSLGERAPQLHLYRGLARVALGRDAEAWQDIAAAQAAGVKDAARQLEAWRTRNSS
mgnify:CR=1 FL=1